jgi:hypothetical protein
MDHMNLINLSRTDELVGVREASHLLDVCPQTVVAMIGRGDIRATRVGLAGRGRGAFRIQLGEISDYLRNRQAEAGHR